MEMLLLYPSLLVLTQMGSKQREEWRFEARWSGVDSKQTQKEMCFMVRRVQSIQSDKQSGTTGPTPVRRSQNMRSNEDEKPLKQEHLLEREKEKGINA